LNKQKLNGFNQIAPFYDALAKIVYGKSVIHAQLHFLNSIEDGSRVLILGGGTGWILKELLSLRPGCEVYYVEASDKMISLSKAKIQSHHRVHFIHGTEESIPTPLQVDVVITNFYLDVFSIQQLQVVASKINDSVRARGGWIVTDFASDKWWHILLLKVMYRFFKTFCKIEASRLPDCAAVIKGLEFAEVDSKEFYNGFIKTTFYKR
jgi:tRNA (cmo5U34)-methyltransferase